MKICSTTPKIKVAKLQRSVSIALGLLAVTAVLCAQANAPAVVHIYRLKLDYGKAVRPIVSCDLFPVARLQNGRVYALKVSKGRHNFTVGESPNGINVDVEPGKEYFVRVDYPVNAPFATGASPVIVPAEQAAKEIQKLKPLDAWYIEAATCGQP